MDTDAILNTAVNTIKTAPSSKEGWNRACDAIFYLKSMGPSAVDGLINALYDPNQNIRLLAVLYLGILEDEGGMVGSRGISAVTNAIGPRDSEIEAIAAGTALALLGDSNAIENTARFMQEFGVYDEHEFHSKSMLTVAEHIARH